MDSEAFRSKVLSFAVSELLAGHGIILDELRRRDVVRSSNSPLSDYAELLFCNAFGWQREGNSAAGHDATDGQGLRYQVKGRRLTRHSKSRQMSAIRNLDSGPFDYLAGVLVDEDFRVIRAALVPLSVVRARATYVAHTNSARFLLRDDIWQAEGVRDVTTDLRLAATKV